MKRNIFNISMKFYRVTRPLASNTTFSGFSSTPTKLIHDKITQNSDLIFIRHAEWTYNLACQEFRKANKIPYVWEQLCGHRDFNDKVQFNPEFVDSPLTEFGKLQCQKAQQSISKQHVDCILVSPQLRTLQTCSQMFQDFPTEVHVQPLLLGPIRSCSDFNISLKSRKTIFPKFNFKSAQNYQQLWFIEYLPDDQKTILMEHFTQKQLSTIQAQRRCLIQLLKQGKIYEDAFTFRKRVSKIKQVLKQYKKKYQKIAMVTHYYTIQYICATDYEPCGIPKEYIDIQNCLPYYGNLQNLLQLGQQVQSSSVS